MQRRHFLQGSLAATTGLAPGLTWAQDKWGVSHGYPTGWAGGLNREPLYRVGNYSGGFEKMLPHRVIETSRSPVAFNGAHRDNFTYRWGFFNRSVQAYLDQWPTTGLLICRGQEILVEQYRHARTPAMRLTSWSMAKSVTSLLLGICLDRKLIESYDVLPFRYVPELAGTLHGSTTLRNLSNMSSGAEVLHDRDNSTIYPSAFTTKTANVFRTVANWNQRREAQGLAYNYNELCPLTLGIVIRKVTGMSMSEFAQQALWQPLGAEANAT